MIKVLVVDDNSYDLNGIVDFIAWGDIGCEIVGTAQDGLEGLEIAKKYRPDIVITDISMPAMNGITMCEKIKEINSDVSVIFISCLEDFETARSAISINATAYITKPINIEELTSAVLNATHISHEVINQKLMIAKLKQEISNNLPYLTETFFRNLLYGSASGNKHLHSVASQLGLSENTDILPVIFGLHNAKKDLLLHIQYLKNELRTKLSGVNLFCPVVCRPDLMAIIISTDIPADDIVDILTGVITGFKSMFSENITVLVGRRCTIASLHTEYYTALEIYDNNYVELYNQVVLCSEIGKLPARSQTMDINLLLQDLKYSLTQENWDCDAFMHKYLSSSDTLYNTTVYNAVLLSTYNILREFNADITENYHDRVYSLFQQSLERNIGSEQFKKVFADFMEDVRRHIKFTDTASSDYIVNNIKKIIHEKYSTIESAEDITESLYLSFPYACRVFKQKTGKSIYNYLISVRINEAKKLLINPLNKAYEVAHKVGYNSSAYFSTSFKNNTGLTPKQFQDLYSK